MLKSDFYVLTVISVKIRSVPFMDKAEILQAPAIIIEPLQIFSIKTAVNA